MTRAQAKRSVLLANAPSACVVAVFAPLFWRLKDGPGPDWWFWVFLAAIPFSIAAGLLGFLFSLERSLTWRWRSVLLALNAAALCFGFYLVITMLQGLKAWGGLRQF